MNKLAKQLYLNQTYCGGVDRKYLGQNMISIYQTQYQQLLLIQFNINHKQV
jgi:hypothetical protein